MFTFLFQIPRNIRRNFIFDLLAGISFGLFFGGINAFLLVQARRLGATAFEVALLAAVPNIWMLLSPLWAKLFEHKCPYKGVFWADGISRLILFFLILNKSAHWYLLIFTFHYFFSSISITVYGKAMHRAYPPEIRGTLMGWVRVGVSLTQMISTAIAGFILPWLGVQMLFAILAIFGLCSSIMFVNIKQVIFEAPRKVGHKISAMKVFLSDPKYRQYMISLLFFGLATTIALPAYPLFQVDVLKVNDEFISLFWMIISFSSLIFYFIGGRFIDRYSPIKLTLFVFLVNLAIPFIYIFTTYAWPLLVIALLQGVVNAGIDLAQLNTVLSMSKEGEINSYMAVHIYLLGVRGTIGPLLAPFLIELLTFKGFFGLIFLFNLAGIFVLWPLIKPRIRKLNTDENLGSIGIQ